jgi:hypothetical protein
VTSLDKATGRDRYFAALEREVEELVDPATGFLSERYSRVIECPLCGGGAHSPLFVKRGYTFVRCDACRLVFANPLVDEALVLERHAGGTSAALWAEVLLSERQLELERTKFAANLD